MRLIRNILTISAAVLSLLAMPAGAETSTPEDVRFGIRSIHGIALGMNYSDMRLALEDRGYEFTADNPNQEVRLYPTKSIDETPAITMHASFKMDHMTLHLSLIRLPYEERPVFRVYSIRHVEDFRDYAEKPSYERARIEAFRRGQFIKESCEKSYDGGHTVTFLLNNDFKLDKFVPLVSCLESRNPYYSDLTVEFGFVRGEARKSDELLEFSVSLYDNHMVRLREALLEGKMDAPRNVLSRF